MRAIAAAAFVVLGGCTSTSLNNALGTPKNPTAVLSDPDKLFARDSELRFMAADYRVLQEAIDPDTGASVKTEVEPAAMRRYLAAGFHLADLYCARYFRKTDEASRRRRFGRALTNDAGTAVSTLLGLVNAGESAVTAVAAGVGLADSSWRNYDDSFMISPDLANVRSLVLAAQDNFRARVLDGDESLPREYGTAQSSIQRYADLCSHLGMRALLDQSAAREQTALKRQTEAIVGAPPQAQAPVVPAPAATPTPAARPAPVPVVPVEPPATATPALAPNRGD